MKIALAQINFTVGDIEANSAKIIDAIERAKEEANDLVIFAEQSISGMPAYDLLRKITFLELCEEALINIASHCSGIAALIGTPILTDHGTISAAAIIQDRQVIRYVGKRNVTARREMGFLVAGSGYEYATIAGHKFAIVVGDDLRRMRDFDNSVQSIISINARKYGRGIMTSRFESLRNVAYMEGKNIIMVNQVGGGADIVYDGTSCVLNKRGETTLMLKSFEEDFASIDIDQDINGCTLSPFESTLDRTRILYDAAVLGLRDFFAKSGYERACIGLSGGVDSSVNASIAVAALGRENVMGIIMPAKRTPHEAVEDAKALAKNLDIKCMVIPVDESYKATLQALEPILMGTKEGATEENIISRIRTTIAMAIQNKFGYVLLNSSNKCENALGLCTLYGDTAGAISVTGDLYKGEIYSIAKYINKTYDAPIPQSIIDKEPSSMIRPDREDARQLPSYEVVDAIIFRMIEKDQHREEIMNAGFDFEHVELIHRMIMHSEKKRFQNPPVLRLSSNSFGHERLMPLTNKYGD